MGERGSSGKQGKEQARKREKKRGGEGWEGQWLWHEEGKKRTEKNTHGKHIVKKGHASGE